MAKKILIVDDEPNIVISLEFLMKKEGFQVETAADGEEALNRVKSFNPDLILLDVMMPGEFDGFEVLKQIKGDPALSAIFVVMVTAKGQSSDFEAGIRAGADGYLIKPFSPLQLKNLLQEHLEK